jgi:hypothetical protein
MFTDANKLQHVHHKYTTFLFHSFICHAHSNYAYASMQLQLQAFRKRRHHSTYSPILKLTLALNSVFLFLNLLVFEVLFDISETFLRSMCVLRVNTVLRLSVLLLELFAATLTYSEPKLFYYIIFLHR